MDYYYSGVALTLSMLYILSVCVFFVLMISRPPRSTLTVTYCPYTSRFRSELVAAAVQGDDVDGLAGRGGLADHVHAVGRDQDRVGKAQIGEIGVLAQIGRAHV